MSDSRVWLTLDELSDRELDELVEAAVFVLSDLQGESYAELTEIPESELAKELTDEVKEQDVIQAAGPVLDASALSRGTRRECNLALMRQLGKTGLSSQIEEAYHSRHKMMAIDAGLLTGPGLLVLLLLRLRRVRVDKTGVDIQFESVKPGLISALKLIITGGTARDD
jgi:hypothetical protein